MSKKWILYIGIALAIFLAIGGYFLWSVKDYTDKVPHITPRQDVTVAKEQMLMVEDLFEIECKGSYSLKLQIRETDIEDATVSEDGKMLYTGSSAGSLRVLVSGTGEVAEHVEAETVLTVQ
jgi:hypothetical protein